jgi:hypothetical protein
MSAKKLAWRPERARSNWVRTKFGATEGLDRFPRQDLHRAKVGKRDLPAGRADQQLMRLAPRCPEVGDVLGLKQAGHDDRHEVAPAIDRDGKLGMHCRCVAGEAGGMP